MADFRKYMFDDFVVESRKEDIQDVLEEEKIPEDIVGVEENTEPEEIQPLEEQDVEESFDSEEVEAEEIIEPSYSKQELDEAVKKAAEEAYQQGKDESLSSEVARQNKLLEEIHDQLAGIFSKLAKKEEECEQDSLRVAVSALRKVFPTLETQAAEAEIKKFLSENFSSISGQEMLSFSFNPESISLVANSIGKLAEQNDFEGKIAVHKDEDLGVSDCRIEWKDGRVERRAKEFLNKVEDMIETDNKERENGE